MEEHFGNYDEVVNVFDEAERIGAEPIDELKEALRSFVLRMNITGKEIKKQQKRKPGRFDYDELMASVMSPESAKPTFTALPRPPTEVADSPPHSQTKNDSQSEPEYVDYDDGVPEEAEEYAENEQQKCSHELGDLLSQMETLSLRRDLDSPTPANATKEDAKGTFMAVTPIRARKKEREEYGAETVLTPVRRSARNTPKWVDVSPETENEKKVKQVLKEVGLPFVPNKALQTKTPSKIKKEGATPGSTAKGRSAKSATVSEQSVSPAPHLNLVLENKVYEGAETKDVIKVSTQDEAQIKTEMPVSAATNALVQAPVQFDSTSRTATPTQSTQSFGKETIDTVFVITPEQPAFLKSEIPSHLLNPTTPFTHSEEEYDDDQYEGASVEMVSPAPSNFFAKNVTPQPILSNPRQLSLSQSTSKTFPSPFTSGPEVSTSPSRAAPSSILRSKHIAQRVPNSALKREVRFDEYSESPVPLSPKTTVMKTPKVDALKLVSMKPTGQEMGTPHLKSTPASFVTLRNTPTIKGTPKMGTPRRAARFMGTPGRVLVGGVKEEEQKRQAGTPKRK
ncbi:hypothetical protein BKA69DRAFT_1102234 [Paraphysoderma sedebokerense]|nr:hypothetical protein BKA69DRAFT_1102234 [Paraphysoderma sedebokerense]